MDKLNTVLRSLDSANDKLYPALAEAVIKSVKRDDEKALLQAIGAITGRGLSADRLLIAIRDQVGLNQGETE